LKLPCFESANVRAKLRQRFWAEGARDLSIPPAYTQTTGFQQVGT
jgi:hypothetical protein